MRRDAVESVGKSVIMNVVLVAVLPGALHMPLSRRHVLGAAIATSSAPVLAESTGPEFWAGRLQGAAPPQPRVVLRDSPPFVILPGFGNDAIDYMEPNGQPRTVSLSAALERRGASNVAVVPIERSQWVNVARGLGDLDFVRGNAQPEGPTYRWYLESAKTTVESTVAARRAAQEAGDKDPRVVLIGHSAGGWLARALCVCEGDEWAQRHVRGIVTLGAPHGSPPEGADQTRGTIVNINKRAPGAYLSKGGGIFYVTVSSEKVVGDADGSPAQKNAFTAYSLVLGRGKGVAGDGFVPIEAAFLDGAEHLKLDCYHSGGANDPWPLDDWYGAERNVDAWLGCVADCLAKQA